MKQSKTRVLAWILSLVMVFSCISVYAAPTPETSEEAVSTEVIKIDEATASGTVTEAETWQEKTETIIEAEETAPYVSIWRENGKERGLYWYEPLAFTWGLYYQNETVSDILNMNEDPALEDWSFSLFFRYTIWEDLTRGNLLWLQAQGIEDLNDAIQLQKTRQIGSLDDSTGSSLNIGLFSLGDYSTTLSLSGSTEIYGFPMTGLGDHGRLWLLKLDGSYVFCGEYGKHSPSGAAYKMTTATAVGVLNDQQLDSLKRIGGYQSYWLEAYQNGTISYAAYQYKYLAVQMWVWYTLNGGRSVSEMPALIASSMSDAAVQTELEDHIASGLRAKEVYFYKNANSANQAMIGFSPEVEADTPVEKAVYLCLTKQANYTNEKVQSAYYGVYSDPECTTQVGSITTGANGYGVSSAIPVKDNVTFYVAEISAPAGTTLNTTIYPVETVMHAHDDPSCAAQAGDNGIVYNMPWSLRYTITKTDGLGTNLSGVTFGIYEWNGSSYQQLRSMTDNGNGTYSTGILYYTKANQGKFRLIEEAGIIGYVNSGWSRDITISPDYSAFLTQVYQGILGRSPDAAGIAAYLPMLQSGTIRLDDLVLEITYSEEYQNKNYSDEQFVTVLYRAMMGREPDASGLAAYVELLANGTATREKIIYIFSGSGEFAGKAGLMTGSSGVVNVPWSGSATVTKQDSETESTVAGAEFMIQQWDGNKYVDLRLMADNGDGTYSTGNLSYNKTSQGRYRLVERTAPAGYTSAGWSREFILTQNNQTFTYEVENRPVKGTIHVIKEDAETGSTPQGDAALEGAVYGLYAREDIVRADGVKACSAGDLVAKETIRGRQLNFKDLYLGKYYIKEITAPKGYTLSQAEDNITLSGKDQNTALIKAEQTVTERVIKQPLQILKVEETHNKSGPVKTLEGAEFTIKLLSDIEGKGWADAVTYDRITTDAAGYATSIPLPYGSYLVRETVTPEDHITMEDFEVTISENKTEPKLYVVHNEPFKAYIRIIKKDALTGETVQRAGAEFKIKDSEGNYLSQKVGRNYVDTFTTDAEGIAQTPLLTVYGTHTICEIKAPAGYVLSEDEITVNVTTMACELDEENIPVLVAEFADLPIRTEYTKTDIVSGEPVIGAQMKITDTSGTVIAEWTTTKEPYSISAMPPGNYILSEVLAPTWNGYVKALDVPFTVLETGEIQRFAMKDDFTKVEISKQDITNSQELPGAELIIKDAEENEIDRWISTEAPYRIDRLAQGEYTLTEITAPAGYRLAEQMSFVVEATGEIQRVVMKDTPYITQLTGTADESRTRAAVVTGEAGSGPWIGIGCFAIAAILSAVILGNKKVRMHRTKEGG